MAVLYSCTEELLKNKTRFSTIIFLNKTMRLKIVLEGKEEFWLEVEPYYTVRTVKNKIGYLYDIPQSNQLITNESIILNNNASISRLNLSSEDTLKVSMMSEMSPKLMRIYCRTWWGECRLLYTNSSCKIAAMKTLICKMFAFPPNSVQLEFRDHPLNDNRLISSYKI